MGDIWLHWAPDYLRAEGVNVRTWPGWETRSRSTGGFDQLFGIIAHHTVSTTSIDNDARYCWENATDRPIGNWLLGRDGTWLMGAAGAANTNGKGGPRVVSQGIIPLDSSNVRVPAIEACNDGVGEPWPVAQQDAYIKGIVGLIKGIRGETAFRVEAGDVHAHSEWAPTRKLDPAGPSRFRPEGGTWSLTDGMDRFRGEVFAALLPPPPPPPPDPVPPGDELLMGGPSMRPRIAKADGTYFLCTGLAVQPKTPDQVDYLIKKLGPELRDLVTPRKALNSHMDVSETTQGSLAAFGRLVAGSD